MKYDKQILYWASLINESEENLQPLQEGLKNKLLGWLGVRSNYEEFENFVDDVASGKAKDKDAQRFVNKIENDDKFIEMRKSLPRRFDEDDLIPTIKEILKDKMNKNVSDKRYQKAIEVMAKVLYSAIEADREYFRKEKAEIDAKLASDREKEKKEREAEYWKKHGSGYPFAGGWRPDDSAKWSEPTWRDDQYAAGRLGEDENIRESSDGKSVIVSYEAPCDKGTKQYSVRMTVDELQDFIEANGNPVDIQDLMERLSESGQADFDTQPITINISRS